MKARNKHVQELLSQVERLQREFSELLQEKEVHLRGTVDNFIEVGGRLNLWVEILTVVFGVWGHAPPGFCDTILGNQRS